jgi:hypothetical protein
MPKREGCGLANRGKRQGAEDADARNNTDVAIMMRG